MRKGFFVDCVCFRFTLGFDTRRLLFHSVTLCVGSGLSCFGLLQRFVLLGFRRFDLLKLLRFRNLLTTNKFCLSFFFRLVKHCVRLLSDFCVELFFLDGNLALCNLRLFLFLCDVCVCGGDFYGFALRFLLYGVRRVRFRALVVRFYLHFRLLNVEFGVLLGDLLVRVHLHGVGLLLRLRSGDGDVALGVGLGDLRILADLLHVVDTHVLDRAGAVAEILDVEVDHLDAQLLHIGHDVLGDLLGHALTILHHFLQADRADDLAHIALEHLRNHGDQLVLLHAQERLGGAGEQHRIAGHLDVGHAVHHDVDEFVGGHGLAGLDVHRHDLQ